MNGEQTECRMDRPSFRPRATTEARNRRLTMPTCLSGSGFSEQRRRANVNANNFRRQ